MEHKRKEEESDWFDHQSRKENKEKKQYAIDVENGVDEVGFYRVLRDVEPWVTKVV